METRVRFLIVGAFALAGIVGLFVFVYWIKSAGGFAHTRSVRVEFQGSASGLRPGAAVLFNGVRIGEVTALSFDLARADVVNADLTIDAAAPLRADARVDIETQGMLGTPVVALSGGSAAAPPLGSAPLRATTSLSLIDQARSALGDLQALVADNKAPLHDILGNIEKFSVALGRNADRVDGLVAGMEKFLNGGPKPPPPEFVDLVGPAAFADPPSPLTVQVAVSEVSAPTSLQTQRISHRSGLDAPFVLGEAQWTDDAPKLIQIKLVEAFETAHLGAWVVRATDAGVQDFRLMVDLRRFEIDLGSRQAVVELFVRLVGKDGRVAQAENFRSEAPCGSADGPPAAAALSTAFAQVAIGIVKWTAAQAH